MNRRVFFRVDASPEIGLGHLRRCGVLAAECRKREIEAHFLIRRHSLDLGGQEFPPGAILHDLPWESTPAEDARAMVELCARHHVEVGVVDHYRMGGHYQDILKEAGLRWMQFGNSRHTHPLRGDLVHDASPGARAASYAARIVDDDAPQFLTGPAYALVGQTFRDQRAGLPPPALRNLDSILLTFGGGDDRGAALAALEWLDTAGFAGRRLLLTTHLNPSLPALRKWADDSPLIELHVDNWQPAPLMAECQLAICAGGTTTFELACLGIPMAIVCIAENQIAPAMAWDAAGLACNLGAFPALEPVSVTTRLNPLLNDPALRQRMATKCWESVDGAGVVRTVDALALV
jgi:UDP-2,4-diacetamido-2,4,6-trideoxy-beta-L-altropyranose hydrolase